MASAPSPGDAAGTLAWVKAHAPDSFQGLAVNFDQPFITAVSLAMAFPNGGDVRDSTVADIATDAWDAILRVDLSPRQVMFSETHSFSPNKINVSATITITAMATVSPTATAWRFHHGRVSRT